MEVTVVRAVSTNSRTLLVVHIYRSRSYNVCFVCIVLLLHNCFRCLVNVDLSSRTTYKKPCESALLMCPFVYASASITRLSIQLTSPVMQTKHHTLVSVPQKSLLHTHCQCDSVQPQYPEQSSFPMLHPG